MRIGCRMGRTALLVVMGCLLGCSTGDPEAENATKQGALSVQEAGETHTAAEAPRWEELDEQAGIDPEAAMLTYLNGVRTELGLPTLQVDPSLHDAAQSHAEFLLVHQDAYKGQAVSVHIQPKDLDGFTGEIGNDRAAFFGFEGQWRHEVVAFKPTSIAATRGWIEALYHRLPLLDPAVTLVGYGEAKKGTERSNVLELAAP